MVWRCPRAMRGVLSLAVMAVVASTRPAAQTLPRPTFAVTTHPTFFFNVWPADVNEDGITDLIGGTRALHFLDQGDLVVAIGRGNGTFHPPDIVIRQVLPLTAADFDADGYVDVAMLSDTTLAIARGNGDGTFTDPVVVDTITPPDLELRIFAHASDLSGDGILDLIVPVRGTDESQLNLYVGSGGLAFQAPVAVPTPAGMWPTEVTSGDFDRDGRRDFAMVNLCCSLSIYLNQGSSTFARQDLDAGLNDIAASDLNGDGRLDLIGVSGQWDTTLYNEDPGQVHVRFGNGNGTFQAPVSYSAGVPGTTSVAIGDFNADGRLDVAAGNRSVIFDSDAGVSMVDSLSVLPGNGTGALLPAVTYALAYLTQGDFGAGYERSSVYWGTHHQLNTSDLNGDRRTDLITSPGATFLNRTPVSNRAPLVFAGPDRVMYSGDSNVDLGAQASDPDRDWLTYRWVDEASGLVVGRYQSLRTSVPVGTARTFTVTVTDGRGGTATDSVTIRNGADEDPYVVVNTPPSRRIQVGVPYQVTWSDARQGPLTGFRVQYSIDDGRTFATIAGCENIGLNVGQCTWANPAPATKNGRVRVVGLGASGWISVSGRFEITTAPILPADWTALDIGNVGAPGTTSFADGVWTIEGSGADIWGTADELRYAYRVVGAEFSFTARVSSIENLDRWVKAGIMVREDLEPDARHVSLFATPRTERGIAFQRRVVAGGPSEHTAGPAVAPPVWLRVGRSGDTVSAYYGASATGPWTLVGRQVLPRLRRTLYVGLAVSSHVDGQLATARFDQVVIQPGSPFNRREDIGAVGQPGATRYDGVVYELDGSGADIWGTADAFHFAYATSIGGIASISARVRSVEPTYPWAKAGVMFRELSGLQPSTEPDARHVMVVVTPGRGVAMQYRPTTGGPSVQVAVRSGAAPAFVSLTRSGQTIIGATSNDGITWHELGQVTLTNLFAAPGLVVTSHDNTTTATAAFDEVRLLPFF